MCQENGRQEFKKMRFQMIANKITESFAEPRAKRMWFSIISSSLIVGSTDSYSICLLYR